MGKQQKTKKKIKKIGKLQIKFIRFEENSSRYFPKYRPQRTKLQNFKFSIAGNHSI